MGRNSVEATNACLMRAILAARAALAARPADLPVFPLPFAVPAAFLAALFVLAAVAPAFCAVESAVL
jgi:hypothetical protein